MHPIFDISCGGSATHIPYFRWHRWFCPNQRFLPTHEGLWTHSRNLRLTIKPFDHHSWGARTVGQSLLSTRFTGSVIALGIEISPANTCRVHSPVCEKSGKLTKKVPGRSVNETDGKVPNKSMLLVCPNTTYLLTASPTSRLFRSRVARLLLW